MTPRLAEILAAMVAEVLDAEVERPDRRRIRQLPAPLIRKDRLRRPDRRPERQPR